MKNTILVLLISTITLSFNSSADSCLDNVEFPESVTPNNDGVNDFLSLKLPCVPDKFEIKIFNRWGNTVYESNDINFEWHGIDEDGNLLPVGVYFYTVSIKMDKEEASKSSNLSLMR